MTEEEDRQAFTARLTQLKQKFRSERAFARACDVSHSQMRHLLMGKGETTRGVLIRIASANGVSVGWLVTGQNDTPPVVDAPPTDPQAHLQWTYLQVLTVLSRAVADHLLRNKLPPIALLLQFRDSLAHIEAEVERWHLSRAASNDDRAG